MSDTRIARQNATQITLTHSSTTAAARAHDARRHEYRSAAAAEARVLCPRSRRPPHARAIPPESCLMRMLLLILPFDYTGRDYAVPFDCASTQWDIMSSREYESGCSRKGKGKDVWMS
uniref:Uncharacterized protein n=1 Tax=Setaria viridis TaxID=4556 RepID=A0A4U6WGG8_SETVI|nr:hypothetical protein SEVIR_1G238366v2 [Setaria viridis]